MIEFATVAITYVEHTSPTQFWLAEGSISRQMTAHRKSAHRFGMMDMSWIAARYVRYDSIEGSMILRNDTHAMICMNAMLVDERIMEVMPCERRLALIISANCQQKAWILFCGLSCSFRKILSPNAHTVILKVPYVNKKSSISPYMYSKPCSMRSRS